MNEIKKALGTTQIARICHVTAPTIGRWIEEGKLPAFNTAGGHRRVFVSDLLSFLKARKLPLPEKFISTGSARILIVDDDPGVRQFIRAATTAFDANCEMREAADGFEAGRLVLDFRPSLVFLDIFLPGLDGLKVCASMRAEPRLADTRIVALSGHADTPSMEARCLQAGADAFLAKPFALAQLKSCLAAYLPQRMVQQ